MSVLGGMLDSVIREIQRDENQRRLRCHVLDPVAKYIEDNLKPYFFTLLIVLLIMVMLLLWILRIALSLKTKVGGTGGTGD